MLGTTGRSLSTVTFTGPPALKVLRPFRYSDVAVESADTEPAPVE